MATIMMGSAAVQKSQLSIIWSVVASVVFIVSCSCNLIGQLWVIAQPGGHAFIESLSLIIIALQSGTFEAILTAMCQCRTRTQTRRKCANKLPVPVIRARGQLRGLQMDEGSSARPAISALCFLCVTETHGHCWCPPHSPPCTERGPPSANFNFFANQRLIH